MNKNLLNIVEVPQNPTSNENIQSGYEVCTFWRNSNTGELFFLSLPNVWTSLSGNHIAVIDNLTSTSTTSSLSANQGRILDGKITTTNNSITTTNSNLTALTARVAALEAKIV